MSKPEDIPQDVWEATEALPIHGDGFCDNDDLATIARAIMAAKAEEREACARRINDRAAEVSSSGTVTAMSLGRIFDDLATDIRKREE